MGYYDAFTTEWATLTGTTQEKLDAINALTAPGPNVDVEISTVVGKLMLAGAYLKLQAFSQGAYNNDATKPHDAALDAAKMLMAMVTTANAPAFAMSDPASNTIINSLMGVILAQEHDQPGTTGFTLEVHDTLIALSQTTVPWWQANGYKRAFDLGDVAAAGVS
jgi:hypothetical protein